MPLLLSSPHPRFVESQMEHWVRIENMTVNVNNLKRPVPPGASLFTWLFIALGPQRLITRGYLLADLRLDRCPVDTLVMGRSRPRLTCPYG